MRAQEQVRQQDGLEAQPWHDNPLWSALATMRIEQPGAAMTFTSRLAGENGWTIGFAREVVQEYRRFLYLAATSAEPVTPSDEVDQAWHLHLTYSRHYWGELCEEILKRPLHHGPTEGGADENTRYLHQYERTLELYRATFAGDPPAAVWPSAGLRFAGRWLCADAGRHWLVPKAVAKWPALAGAGSLVAACSAVAAGPGTIALWTVGLLFILTVPLLIAITVSSYKARKKAAEDGGGGGYYGGGDGISIDCGGSGGGDCGGGGCGS